MSEGTSRSSTSVLSRVQDNLVEQAKGYWEKMPEAGLVALIYRYELRQWELQVQLATTDDALTAAKLRGAIEEVQNQLEAVFSEGMRRRTSEQAQEGTEDE